jgi:hypothetical protein
MRGLDTKWARMMKKNAKTLRGFGGLRRHPWDHGSQYPEGWKRESNKF